MGKSHKVKTLDLWVSAKVRGLSPGLRGRIALILVNLACKIASVKVELTVHREGKS
jgi:hypothetical protein